MIKTIKKNDNRSIDLGADPFLCWFAILSKSNHVRSVHE